MHSCCARGPPLASLRTRAGAARAARDLRARERAAAMLGAGAAVAANLALDAAVVTLAVQIASRARADDVLLCARVYAGTLKVAHATRGADEIGVRATAVRTADHLARHRGARGAAERPRRDRADVRIACAAGRRAGGQVCLGAGAGRIHRRRAARIVAAGGDLTVVGSRRHGVKIETTATLATRPMGPNGTSRE